MINKNLIIVCLFTAALSLFADSTNKTQKNVPVKKEEQKTVDLQSLLAKRQELVMRRQQKQAEAIRQDPALKRKQAQIIKLVQELSFALESKKEIHDYTKQILALDKQIKAAAKKKGSK